MKTITMQWGQLGCGTTDSANGGGVLIHFVAVQNIAP